MFHLFSTLIHLIVFTWLALTRVYLTCFDRGLYRYLCVVFGVRRFQRKNYSVPQVFEETVAQHPDKVAFVFEDKQWTFKQVGSWTCHHRQPTDVDRAPLGFADKRADQPDSTRLRRRWLQAGRLGGFGAGEPTRIRGHLVGPGKSRHRYGAHQPQPEGKTADSFAENLFLQSHHLWSRINSE